MSLLTRPSVICAIVFGCFAVLVPRVFLPLFRPRQSSPPHHIDDHFRRTRSPMSRSDDDNPIEHLPDSSLHMSDVRPNMPLPHSTADGLQLTTTEQKDSKSAFTFALPMYTVGIGVFFIYTCFKYWSNRNTEENKIKVRYSSNNIQWNAQKRKFKYQANHPHDDDDQANDEDLYTGLDPDYVEYLRLKKQKEIDVKQTLTTEQRQMDHTLDEMKNSFSFISSKLGANPSRSDLTNNEISQLQDRLASTEAQMCKILNALDAASNQVNQLSKHTRQSLEQPQETYTNEEEHRRLSSRSPSASGDSANEEENSDSEEDSAHQDEQPPRQEEDDEESSSSYEEEERMLHEEDHDSESESSSERYGIMTTNYQCDPTTIDDYELDTSEKVDQTVDSQTKVQEWNQRNHSQSLSSSNSSIEKDQAIPNEG